MVTIRIIREEVIKCILLITCVKFLNMSEHTLRHYTDNNLLPNPKRDHNNRRIYDDEDLDWLRDLGFSIKEI